MISGSVGWGIDNHAILKSTDGGATWQNVAPSTVPAGSGFVTSFFLDASTGWVGYSGVLDNGGGVLRTSDGGATWLAGSVPGAPSALTFADATDGWMLVPGVAATADQPVDVYRTTDAGATWSKVSGVGFRASAPPGSLPLAGDKSGIAFVTSSDGWVTGTAAALGNLLLYQTTDRGVTWQQQVLPSPSGYDLSAVQLEVSSPTFFGSEDGMMEVAGTTVFLYTTRNGGTTWQPAGVTPSGTTAVSFATPMTGWALQTTGTSASLQGTQDGGAAWTALALPDGFAPGAVQLVTPQVGFAWGSAPGEAWRTTDGGHTWQTLRGVSTTAGAAGGGASSTAN